MWLCSFFVVVVWFIAGLAHNFPEVGKQNAKAMSDAPDATLFSDLADNGPLVTAASSTDVERGSDVNTYLEPGTSECYGVSLSWLVPG